MLGPGAADFIEVLLDKTLSFGDLLWLEAEVRRQFNGWFDPELRFAVSMLNVDVRPPLLTREKIEPKPSDSQYGRTHDRTSIVAYRELSTRMLERRKKRAVPQRRWALL
jgi:hypothetical protein